MSEERGAAQVPLTRWQAPPNRVHHVVCIGDSITYAPSMPRIGIDRAWVDQLAAALDDATGPRPGDGFHGLWRDEWIRAGSWAQPTRADEYDVAPFRQALYSSGRTADELTWVKPTVMTVGAFEIYWFSTSDMGRWQYRVDDGPWMNVAGTSERTDSMLHRTYVGERVHSHVQIRGHDGSTPCVAPIAGISVWSSAGSRTTGTVVHNLGHQQQMLATFCRSSAGDPLALLDDLRPDLITVLFSNDVSLHDAASFERSLRWLVRRVESYADALLVAPFEQRPPRRVGDVVTGAGSRIISSKTALFLQTDSRSRISGTNIADGAAVDSVESLERATMTVPATASSMHGELEIHGQRAASTQAEYRAVTRAVADTTGCAFLDLHDAWASSVGAGWDAAWAAGLMYDGFHPTQRGHDAIAARVLVALGLDPTVRKAGPPPT